MPHKELPACSRNSSAWAELLFALRFLLAGSQLGIECSCHFILQYFATLESLQPYYLLIEKEKKLQFADQPVHFVWKAGS